MTEVVEEVVSTNGKAKVDAPVVEKIVLSVKQRQIVMDSVQTRILAEQNLSVAQARESEIVELILDTKDIDVKEALAVEINDSQTMIAVTLKSESKKRIIHK